MQQDTEEDGSLLEIIELAHSLRQEQLFITNEQNSYISLNESLVQNASRVAQMAWICAQHWQNLRSLIVSRPETGPSLCCHRANKLENVKFVNAYKAKNLKYEHVLAYRELFNYLHRSPYLLAQTLMIGDQISTPDEVNSVVNIIVTGLYGNAMHSKDIEMILKLLGELVDIQIIGSDNPRRLLRSGACAFSRLYQRLHESLISAKLFLTVALNGPIMRVLTEDELMLEIDPQKAILNIPQREKLKKFGEPGTPDYDDKIKEYRKTVLDTLISLASEFFESLTVNWCLFPSTLRWLIHNVYQQLKQSALNEKEINEIITDMVFTNFICPVVLSPDLFGITDAPISENARFNLIQIGQIIQMMALIKYENIEGRYSEVYSKFETNTISDLLVQLVETDYDVRMTMTAIPHTSGVAKTSVLITQNELNKLVDFLREVLENDGLRISGENRRKLSKLLEQLPDKWETIVNGNNESIGGVHSMNNSNRASKSLMNLSKNTKSKFTKSISLISSDGQTETATNGNVSNGSKLNSTSKGRIHNDSEPVLIIDVNVCDDNNFHLLSEEEVLNMNSISSSTVHNENGLDKIDAIKSELELDQIEVNLHADVPKQTRFSMSHDDASMGNASDNLEAVSEAPSNHSVTSSLDIEENDQNIINDNDNLSDMTSANVSGRGTPNISGRDTPSSQVTEGENCTAQLPTSQIAQMNKARSDIEDKFCKFEIKKLIEGDETVSIISDTWSTDVLASDSETIDANLATPLIPSSFILPGESNFDALTGVSSNARTGNYLDTSETHSESAWSTDVLASDSEKMTEVDTDDNQSIAAKSDIDSSRDIDVSTETLRGNADSPFFSELARSNRNSGAIGLPLRNFATRPFDNAAVRAITTIRGPSERFPLVNNSYGLLDIGAAMNTSPLAGPSARLFSNTTPENKSQFRSSFERNEFLLASNTHMHRQNSAESSVSNHSSNEMREENVINAFENLKLRDEDAKVSSLLKQDDDVNVVQTSEEIRNPFLMLAEEQNATEEVVEHRRVSADQRNAIFDGRRNGVLNIDSSLNNKSGIPNRRYKSLNYENHEIINQKTRSLHMIPTMSLLDSVPITDDAKNQQQEIAQKSNVLNDQNQTDDSTSSSKPASKYTGAIPKSISFDSSADKNHNRHLSRRSTDRNNNSGRMNGQGLFNKIRQGFKNRRVSKLRSMNEMESDGFSSTSKNWVMGSFDGAGDNIDADSVVHGAEGLLPYLDNEDILAKYAKRKVSSSSEATSGGSIGSTNAKDSQMELEASCPMDQSETPNLFNSAKRKLRSVLSNTDLQSADFRHINCQKSSPLLVYLQIQYAQALNLQDQQQITYVSEAIRTLKTMDTAQHESLVSELQADLLKRQNYLQYLTRYRQNMLLALKNVERYEERLLNERRICTRHLIMVCIRMFLEKREHHIVEFQEEFTNLTVVDEKIDLLEEYMEQLMTQLRSDGILQGMAEWQLQEARICIERILFQRLYRLVMFPNEDADLSRDEVLHEHIDKLSNIITPSHSSLRIPQILLLEAPWPHAQQQMAQISAYKSPREKLLCIVRCIHAIMSLLEMASNRTISADDLVPVLIYVIIKTNPPYLLSTIEYVNCFLKTEGADQYWWTQFCSAVTFIKTMDYSD